MGRELASVACHDGPVTTLRFGSSPSVIYSGGIDGAIRQWVWNESGHVDRTAQLRQGRGNVSTLQIDSESKVLFSGYSDGRIEVVPLTSDASLEVLDQHSDFVSAIVQHPRERLFVSGSYDGNLSVWEYPGGTECGVLEDPHGGPITGVAFDTSGEVFATSGLRSPVFLWNTHELTRRGERGNGSSTIVGLKFVPLSDQLVTVGYTGPVCVYEAEAEEPDIRIQLDESGDYPMAMDDQGTKIAIGTDSSVNVYDRSTGALLGCHRSLDSGVFAVEFVPQTDAIAVGCGNGEIRVIDPTSEPTSPSQ